MAHFAQLDENNTVITVIVVANEDILDENNNESEEVGILFCKSLLGQDTIWKQTSYNSNFRVRFASIGYSYNEELNAFIKPSPDPSWIFNEETCDWDPPAPIE
jgi:hypothetical protein